MRVERRHESVDSGAPIDVQLGIAVAIGHDLDCDGWKRPRNGRRGQEKGTEQLDRFLRSRGRDLRQIPDNGAFSLEVSRNNKKPSPSLVLDTDFLQQFQVDNTGDNSSQRFV